MSIKIYQNYLSSNELAELDPGFIPHSLESNPQPHLREIYQFFNFYDSAQYKEADYVGVLSKKFFEKTRIQGSHFIEFIKNNPGYDVYFINPFPQNAYYSYNIWHQGEFFHPGIIDATQSILDLSGTPIKLDTLGRQDKKSLLYCNYWVGNANFWEKYIPFLKTLYNCIEKLPDSQKEIYYSNGRYINLVENEIKKCPLFPFIFERLFSTFLLAQHDIKYLAYTHSTEEIKNACLNDMEWRVYNAFHQVIDTWDSTPSDKKIVFDAFDGLLNLTWGSIGQYLKD